MKICALDAFTMNPGDLSWNAIESLGELIIYDRSAISEIVERAYDADIILTNKVELSEATIATLPNLKCIAVTATGYNIIDLDAASKHGVAVLNIPAYSTDSVPQFVFAHILEWASRVYQHSDAVHDGEWARSNDFSFTHYPLIELAGLTMGVVGYGNIGKRVCSIAKAFSMNVIVHTRTVPDDQEGIDFVDLETLLKQSDVVSLNCPLTPKTDKMINASRLDLMKESAFLVNCSRGQLVDESALADALANHKISAAGIDVLTQEPPQENHPLTSLENCFITPHIAWATKAARQRMMDILYANIKSFQDGNSQNQVN